MSILLLMPNKNRAALWRKAFEQIDSNIHVQIWPDVESYDSVILAVVWHYPSGELLKYPNLKCIASVGAGVDHIMLDKKRPQQVPIVRVVDEFLTRDMTRYIVWAVLNHSGRFNSYPLMQKNNEWHPQPKLEKTVIGIMGFGELGQATAASLLQLKFDVVGWSQTRKDFTGVTSYAGEAELPQFLQQTDILICLLPLTPQTQFILNLNTFNQLKRGAYLINVARGKHLNEQDLITALNEGQLSGACLDVFQQEPLPKEHPFWQHPKIIITPHIASITNQSSVAKLYIENYYRLLNGHPLLNQVDITRGY